MNISKRLNAVISHVTPGNRFADIGCDHGFVPIELVSRGICPSGIAADVKAGPLERAKEHIAAAGLQDRIETRLSDGLEAFLPGEADTLILSGIGGRLMIRILREGERCAKSAKELVLSPQSDLEAVRKYLYSEGYRILSEELLSEEGKFYHILKTLPEADPEPWSEADFYCGKRFSPECLETVRSFLKQEAEKCAEIAGMLGGRDGSTAPGRRAELQVYESLLRKKLEEIGGVDHEMQ